MRREAKKTPCINNLKQKHVAIMLYLDDYNEYPFRGMRFLLPYARITTSFCTH